MFNLSPLRYGLILFAFTLIQLEFANNLVAQEKRQATDDDLDADYPDIVKTTETFYQDPTQERMNNLTALIEKHKQIITPQSKVGALTALAAGRASQAFDLTINGDADALEFARQIAGGEREKELFDLLAGGTGDPREVDFWRYSFAGSGNEDYLDKLLEITDDYIAVMKVNKGELPRIMAAEATLLNLSRNHPKVLGYMKKAGEQEKWKSKHAHTKRYVAYSTEGWDEGKAFDRNTAEGTLRLFTYGVKSGNGELIRATSELLSADDLKVLTRGKNRGPAKEAKKAVADSKVNKLKAGEKWKVPGGKKEMTVGPSENSDRSMIAYIGPDGTGTAPIQVFKIGGVWWVQPAGVILVRKTARKLKDSRKD